MAREAIGVVETLFYTTAVELVDVMCKTAGVEVLCVEKELGGRLVTVIIGGSVSDVTAAVEAAREQCRDKPGDPLRMSVVIPRPHEEIMKFIEPAENTPKPPDIQDENTTSKTAKRRTAAKTRKGKEG